MNTVKKQKPGSPEPQVGIFWLVKGKLVFDATTLQEAEPYGDHLTHSRSHIDVWREYRRTGSVPPECQYEEFPRGRVMYHRALEEFTILADQCILDRKDLITQIKTTLHLPSATKLGSDSHYRCFSCLYGEG